MLSDAGRVRGTQDSAFGNDAVDQFRRRDIESWIPAVASMRGNGDRAHDHTCLLYTSPSPRDATLSRMPSSA